MRPVSESEVERWRSSAADTMPDLVKILRDTKVYDGGGGYHSEFLEVAQTRCTIGLPLGGESDERNKSRVRIADELTHTVRMPAKTDVVMTDRLEVVGGDLDGQVFEVNGVMKRGKWEIARDVKVVSL